MDSGIAPAELESRPSRRRWWVAAAVVLVAFAGVTFVRWGSPRLTPGGPATIGTGMTWADDGIRNTAMVVRGRPGGTVTATFSLHNDGHLPFTVRAADRGDPVNWLAAQQITFGGARASEVTLEPGGTAAVNWSLDMTCQPTMGGVTTVRTLPFRVSWLGLSTTRKLTLAEPITFVGGGVAPEPRPAGC